MDQLGEIVTTGYRVQIDPGYIITLMGKIEHRELAIFKQFKDKTLEKALSKAYEFVKNGKGGNID